MIDSDDFLPVANMQIWHTLNPQKFIHAFLTWTDTAHMLVGAIRMREP